METNGKSNGVSKHNDGVTEWASWRWILLFLAPTLLFLMDVSCIKGSCRVGELFLPTTLSAYINLDSLFLYTCWMVIQIFLFLLPVGTLKRHISTEGKPYKFRTNGSAGYFLLCSVVALTIFTGFTEYLSKIADHFLSLHVLSVITAFFISRRVSNATSGQLFYTGSYSNPTLLGWDLKRFLIRSAQYTWVIITFAHQVAANKALQHNSPFLIITIFHFFAVGEAMWFEESNENTLLFKYEKVGAMFVYTCLTAIPVLVTSSVRYLSFVDEQLNEAPLIIRFLISVPGYCLYRGALADRSSFEKNPNHPDFEELYVIREEGGKSVLADSYWGHCRNPNYLGCLILIWCCTSFGYDNIYFHSCFLTLAVFLVYRSIINDRLNSQIYGTRLWSAYQEKVKNRILKFVF